jgi:hypothetical protein
MVKDVMYHTDAPRINRTFADMLETFKQMKAMRVSSKIMREQFLKDELLAIALWYAEKAEAAEGGHTSDIFSEYEEVSHE